MFTERDALVYQARQADLVREAELERHARNVDRAPGKRRNSLGYRLGHALEMLGQRLQQMVGRKAQEQGSPSREAAYER